MTLLCIESPDQIAAAKAAGRLRLQDGSGRCGIVALTPHAEYALARSGLPHRRPEDYYDEDEIHRLGCSELARVDQVCAALDQHIQAHPSVYRELEPCAGSLDWYHMKLLLNSVVVPVFLADRIVARERPQQVVCFSSPAEPISRHLYFVDESVWSHALPLVCRARGIPCTVLPAVGTQVALRGGDARALVRHAVGETTYHWLRRVYWRVRLLNRARRLSRRGRTAEPERPCVVLLSLAYSLGLLADEIGRQGDLRVLHWNVEMGDPPVFLDRPASAVACHGAETVRTRSEADAVRLWEALPHDRFMPLFDLDGVNFFPVIEPRLRYFFLTVLPDMLRVERAATKLFRSVKPVALVGAVMGDYRNHVVARVARRLGIPVMVYKHGASAAYVWMETGIKAYEFNLVSYRNDIRSADYHLVNGEGDQQYYERYCPGPTRIVPVGSAALDALRRQQGQDRRTSLCRRYGLDPARKVVMYVPIHMDGRLRSVPYNNRSPSQAFAIERALVSVFREFPRIQFVIKALRTRTCPVSPIAELIKDEGIGNCRVITDPFQEVLSLADLFVLDYVSTLFLEALTTDRPILLCGHLLPWKWAPGVWHPSVLEMWKERIAYAEDLHEFLELLRTYLKEERFDRVQSSDTLLKLFGTHLDDGKSAERAYLFLRSLNNLRASGTQAPEHLAAEKP